MTTTIRFGTDGWRALIAEDFTFANVRLCTQAAAQYLKETGQASAGLVIGYDTRFASEDFAAAVAEVVAGNGIPTFLCPQPTPTPVVSYGILEHKAAGGIIITASHNPASWSGFKYKPQYAGSASPEVVAELERHIAAISARGEVKRLSLEQGRAQGLIESYDPGPAYRQHLGELADLEGLRRAGLKLAVDSMYGTGAGYFRQLIGGGPTEILEIHAERNPLFPGLARPEPIPPNTDALSSLVVEQGANLGLATDGDADRVGLVDERGRFITQLQVFALLALYLLEVRGERGAIIKTVTTTGMTHRLGELFKVAVYETPVGFKYVGPMMLEHNALIGGEESGGFGFRGHIPERDGILSGLFLADLVVKTGKTISELIDYLYQKVGPHHYQRLDFEFPAEEGGAIRSRLDAVQPEQIEGAPVAAKDTKDGYRFVLSDGSWLAIRFSGTEPILRIYAETDSPARVHRLLAAGRKLAGL